MTGPRRGLGYSAHGTSNDPDQHWSSRAACLDEDPELFHPADNERATARAVREAVARAVCATCPVKTDCREHALTNREPDGVWGGLSETERRALLRKQRRPAQPRPRKPRLKYWPSDTPEARKDAAKRRALKRRQEGNEPPCGTRAGYDHHRALGEPYCEACTADRRRASARERELNRKDAAEQTAA